MGTQGFGCAENNGDLGVESRLVIRGYHIYAHIHTLDGYPASLGFAVMHRVHAICTQS